MTFNQLLTALRQKNRAEIRELAERAGMSEHSVVKIWNGATKNPGILACERLMPYLASARGARKPR